ncbi:ABC transporter substrate-binding protein [Paenibacillus sp. N1-5-1-14]|uniref:ABC transporter substrate-binding protein n=1 Tax=Paenibacillus radicibacter TaxID=2972488 RepID=UPI0021597381|nr:ABC transporter substrate-binding protein [Paenibacillus radicibacter]MCR8642849.1 ABC transporter substrate-binding protein [Paenibacillus radicibacter]
MHRYLGYKKSSIRQSLTVISCLLLAGSLLAACGKTQEVSGAQSSPKAAQTPASSPVADKKSAPATELVVKDEQGHEVKIPASPKRVFAPYLEDSLLKLGVKPVAQWANGSLGHDYLQDQLQGIPKADFSAGSPSPEVIMSFNPDLIILQTATYGAKGVYEQYAKIAPTYVFNSASGEVEKSLATIGKLLGKSSEADQALKAYEQKVKDAKEKLAKAVGGKKVAVIRFAAKGISMMGGNYLAGNVVHQQLGLGKSKLVEKENSAPISMEVLPQLDADYIFVINQYGQGTEKLKEMTSSPIWNSIPAVKAKHVYEVSDKYWLGSGLIAYEKIIDDVLKNIVK